MKDTEDKAAFSLAVAVGLPWLLLGAWELGLVPGWAGSSIALLGVGAFTSLVTWGLVSLKGIRAYAVAPPVDR